MTTLPIIVLASFTGVSEGQNIQGEGRKLALGSNCLEIDVQYPAHNVPGISPVRVGTVDDCIKMCKDKNECAFLTYLPNKTCLLKTSEAKSRRQRGDRSISWSKECGNTSEGSSIDNAVQAQKIIYLKELDRQTVQKEKINLQSHDVEKEEFKEFLKTVTDQANWDHDEIEEFAKTAIEGAINGNAITDLPSCLKTESGGIAIKKNFAQLIANTRLEKANKMLHDESNSPQEPISSTNNLFKDELLRGNIEKVDRALSLQREDNNRPLRRLEQHSTQENVDTQEILDLVTKVTDVADVFAEAGSDAFANLSSHITLVEPSLVVLGANADGTTKEGRLRSLLEVKLNILALVTADFGPVGTLLNFSYQLSTAINNDPSCENQDTNVRGNCDLKQLNKSLPIIALTAVLETIGNGHLLDALNIFTAAEKVGKEKTLTALDVEDVLLIGAAAMRGGCLVATFAFPLAVTPCNVAVKLVEIASAASFDDDTEAALDNFLEGLDDINGTIGDFVKGFQDKKILAIVNKIRTKLGGSILRTKFIADKALKFLGGAVKHGIDIIANVGRKVFVSPSDYSAGFVIRRRGTQGRPSGPLRGFHQHIGNAVNNLRKGVEKHQKKFEQIKDDVATGFSNLIGGIFRRKQSSSRRAR